MNTKLGFIGGGNMAASLIGGLVPNTITANNVMVFEPNADKAQELQQRFGIQIAQDNAQLVSECDAVVIAVKPQVLHTVLSPLAAVITKHCPLLISIVAGIRGNTIEQWLGQSLSLVRVMPNTPALVGAGISGLYANTHVTEAQKQLTETLLNSVGQSVWVNSESDIDSVTALSGSGPAYFMLFIKALSDAAEHAGLPPETAIQLASETARGAALLVQQSDQSLEQLIDNVTSPGGTTEKALKSMHANNLTKVLTEAFDAARQRSEELALELSQT